MDRNEAPRTTWGNSDSPILSPPRHVSTLPDYRLEGHPYDPGDYCQYIEHFFAWIAHRNRAPTEDDGLKATIDNEIDDLRTIHKDDTIDDHRLRLGPMRLFGTVEFGESELFPVQRPFAFAVLDADPVSHDITDYVLRSKHEGN